MVTPSVKCVSSVGSPLAMGWRITHLFDLTLLAPDFQERIQFVAAVDGVEPMSHRALRAVAHAGSWKEQLVAWTVPFCG